MAGTGRRPKRAGQRRNRSAPQRGEWVVLDRARLKAPPLPRPYPRGGYSAQAKTAWKSWWGSPMAPMWDEAERDMVEMLLRMVDGWWSEPTAAMATQIRLYRDTLGLTPKGRQDRRWLLPSEAEPSDVTPISKAKSHRPLRAVD